MLTEIQEKWLQALESGEYKQVCDELHYRGGYCCLGVATHVLYPDHEALKFNGWMKLDSPFKQQTAPPDVQRALGLRDDCGYIKGGNFYDCLTEMNDSGRFSFKEIAAFIRENPEKVFIQEQE